MCTTRISHIRYHIVRPGVQRLTLSTFSGFVCGGGGILSYILEHLIDVVPQEFSIDGLIAFDDDS